MSVHLRLILVLIPLLGIFQGLFAQFPDDSLSVWLGQIKSTQDQKVAENLSRKALDRVEALFPDSLGWENEFIFRLAKAKHNQGRLRPAIELYQQSLELHHRSADQDSGRIIWICRNLGNAYTAAGDFKLAEEYYGKSLRMAEIRYGPDSKSVAATYTQLGLLAQVKGEIGKSMDFHRKAMRIRMKPAYASDGRKLAIARKNYGDALLEGGEIEMADTILQSALRAFVDMYGENHFLVAQTKASLAEIELLKGDTALALEILEEASRAGQYQDWPDKRILGKFHFRIAEVQLAKGEAKKAINSYQLALVNFLPGFLPADVRENPWDHYLIPEPWILEVLVGKGDAFSLLYEQEGDLEDKEVALKTYETAAKQVDFLRSAFSTTHARLNLAEVAFPLYEKLIAACLEEGWKTKAFEYSERSKAILLLGALQEERLRNMAGISEEHQFLQDSLTQELWFWQDSLGRSTKKKGESGNFLNEAEDSLWSLHNKLEALQREWASLYPDYYQLALSREPDSLRNFEAALGKRGQTCLSYFWGPSRIFLFRISGDGTMVFQIERDDEFGQKIHRLIKMQQKPDGGTPQEYGQVGYQVFHDLVDHFAGELPERLLIIPDGDLHQLSFDALPARAVAEHLTSFKDYPFLIRESAIQYTWSASVMMEIWGREAVDFSSPLLAVAPEFSGTVPLALRDSNLAALPEARKSALEVADWWSGEAWTGSRANEADLKAKIGDFQVLHFATHGLLDLEEPMNSSLVLGPEGEEDGLLHTWEIYNLPLQSDLAVLSACQTGAGKVVQGEGMLSLARGFTYSGARSVVVNRWQAQDFAARELTGGFFQHLLDGEAKDIALQKAKLEWLESADAVAAQPFYWSGMVCAGDAAPLEGTGGMGWQKLFGVGLGIICSSLVGWGWIRRKKRLN